MKVPIRFSDVTEQSGMVSVANNQGAAWVDVNGDGFLDLFVGSYGLAEDKETAARDYLFINQGDGTFVDMTEPMGMTSSTPFHARGVCVADYDADGDPDVYVGNYRLDPNFLWQNQGGNKGFIDVAFDSGTQGVNENFTFAYGHTIGPAFGDLNEDGLFDLVVPNLAHPRFISFSDPTSVYINQGDGTFENRRTEAAGIAYQETHSEATLFDIDSDGDLDLFISAVYEGQHAYLYENDSTGYFRDVTYESGVLLYNGWGAASSDLDGDGDMDLVASGIWENTAWDPVSGQTLESNYLAVRLTGGAVPGDAAGWSNRDAIGAVVTVTAGDRTLTRQVEGGKGVGCQNSSTLNFGLGSSDEPVDIHIVWPSGRTFDMQSVALNQVVQIHERP